MENLIPTKDSPVEDQPEVSKSIRLDGEEINEMTVLLREKLVGESKKEKEDSSNVQSVVNIIDKRQLVELDNVIMVNKEPTHGSPNPSPNMKQLHILNGQLVDNIIDKSQSAINKEQTDTNTPNRKDVSAKLKKLLSRNLSIAEKLEDGDISKTNKNKDPAGTEKLATTEGNLD
ncbi:hypothetical protein L2E82_44030 [Cichorium intybus]|uniref:Uncharacterized protein n=1 Tax=Cichorium intybus TaxID=13427 RepID=A0ACB8ZPG0_CICIN|nr:hypothetical protein L2E82_44030 [Cichorium intybus]